MKYLFAAVLAIGPILAQTPPTVDIQAANTQFLRDYAETRGFSLGHPMRATPTPEGDAVLFLRSQPRKPDLELYEYQLRTGETRVLITPADVLKGAEETLSAEEKALRERMRVSLRGFTDFKLSKDGKRVLLSLSGKLYVLDRQSKAVQELKTSPGTLVDAKFSPDGRNVSYVLGQDVYIYDLTANREQRVTTGGTEMISHGLAEFVAREEMGRFSGYWWSPDSGSILYQETDHTGVEVWYVADPAKPEEEPYRSFYPRPGKKNVSVRLGIIPVSGGQTRWIKWDREQFPYLNAVAWEKSGPLTLTVQSRTQQEQRLLTVDPKTGGTSTLLKEISPHWVTVRQDVPRWISPQKGFLWASEASGAWQLEWRKPDGTLREMVQMPGRFRSLIDLNAEKETICATARPHPVESRLYTIRLGGTATELGPEAGWHDGNVNETHTHFVETFTAIDTPSQSRIFDGAGKQVAVLPSVAEKPALLPKVEITRAGTDPVFNCAVVRPRDFKPGERYPVINHVYGGPVSDWSAGKVSSVFRSWLLPQWIADQGFIVVSIDGRGTGGRGTAWERAISRNFHGVTLEDQIAGMKALGHKYPEMDLERVGIFGWSFGGYMSALAVLKRPDFFKSAVAGAPVSEWLDYDTHYTEQYLGLPESEERAYRDGSLLPLAPKLSRPLLLIHGTSDDNVYFRHSLRLANELFRAGKYFEFLPLASFTHMVPDPVVNERLYSRIMYQFQRDLVKSP